MSPVATSKTAASSVFRHHSKLSAVFVDYAGDDAPANHAHYSVIRVFDTTLKQCWIRLSNLFCLDWHFDYSILKTYKIEWTTSIRTIQMPGTASTTPTSAWTEFNLGSSATVTGLIPGKTYLVRTSSDWTEGKGEFRTNIKAGTTSLSMRPYNSNGALIAVSYEDVITIPSGVTTATIQRAYSGEKIGVRVGTTRVTFQIIN